MEDTESHLRSTGDREVLSITLTSSSAVLGKGEASGVSIEVRNVGAVTIWVVGVVDGSEAGARFPRWIPLIEPRDFVAPMERPDFTAPLSPSDFRRLEPGEAFDPTRAVNGARYFPISMFESLAEVPERYRLALELDTTASDERDWAGSVPDHRSESQKRSGEVHQLLLKVPRLRVRSNTLELVVR
jgi:hypothetical protein